MSVWVGGRGRFAFPVFIFSLCHSHGTIYCAMSPPSWRVARRTWGYHSNQLATTKLWHNKNAQLFPTISRCVAITQLQCLRSLSLFGCGVSASCLIESPGRVPESVWFCYIARTWYLYKSARQRLRLPNRHARHRVLVLPSGSTLHSSTGRQRTFNTRF